VAQKRKREPRVLNSPFEIRIGNLRILDSSIAEDGETG
jgi:hypothetical protein